MTIPARFGSYEIVEEIGKGGMAAVYRARQQSVDRDVAIKVILKGIAGDPAAVQRFQREAKLIARLEHPHILPVYDFDGSHEPPYIVMRYLDGGTLKDVMAQGLLPHNEVVYLMQQICSALDYAHRQGIIHRDIKPSNILIDREGNAFVSDLGLARLTGTERGAKNITETGAIMGTPDYMSPEQATGVEDIDHRTDIYALGVMLFEMLTGSLPFDAPSGMQMLIQHMQSPVPSVLLFQPELPEAIEAVLQKVLAKNRDDRYQSAVELSGVVAAALGVTSTGSVVRLREAAGTSIIRRRGKQNQTDSQATPSEQNKTVTVLYTSAVEYGEIIAESNGDEAARRALAALWTALERITGEFGGQIFSRTEHELLALWGSDTAREDDAEQAIRAALAMQKSLRELGAVFVAEDEPLPLNIGIHRGLTLLTPGEKSGTFSASGATITLANRLMQNAEGVILITHEVFRQVLGVFDIQEDEPLKLRGRAEKINTYRVTAAKRRAFRVVLRGIEGVETPLVGRDAEFKHLQKAFLTAFEDSETQVVTVVSEPGIGKSRLLYEFDKWSELRPELYRIFNGRATPAMTQRPYALIRDIISTRFEVLDDDAPAVALQKVEAGVTDLIGKNAEIAHFIAYLSGMDVAESPYLKGILSDAQETNRRARQAFIKLITTLAKREPVLLELEDFHYADEASLDLLTDLFAADENGQLLVIVCTRPALYDRRPSWGSGQLFHTRVDLKPLDKRDSRDLAVAILQKVTNVPKTLRDILVERAEGNPLYMEELVKTLIDDRVIIKDSEDVWRVEIDRLGALNVPSTLAGLLESRFDTLLHPEKVTLQRASVIGRLFYDTALQAIDNVDDTHLRDLSDILAKLVERGFIYKRETSAFADSTEYIFASAMLRDTLYDRLLERQLRVYHTGAAAWLANLDRANDYLPLIAEHFEKASDTQQAAAFLQQAGDNAAQRGTYQDAIGFYQRAVAFLPPDTDPTAKLPLLLALGEALNRHGDISTLRPILTDTLALARAVNDSELLANTLYQLSLMETTYGDYPTALAYLNEALPLARAGTDAKTLANVLYGLANTSLRVGNYAEGVVAAEECVALCEKTGDDVLRVYALNRLATLQDTTTNSPVYNRQTILGHYEVGLALARQIGHRQSEQAILSNLGSTAAFAKDWQQAIVYTQQALQLAREMEDRPGVMVAGLNLGEYHLRVGLPDKAVPLLHEALAVGQGLEVPALLVAVISIVAALKLTQGKLAEGLALLELVRSHPAATNEEYTVAADWLDYARDKFNISDAEIEAGLAAGKALDVDTVVAELLRELA